MSFWTTTAGANAQAVAKTGKVESFLRKWRATTFWDVARLDATGHAAVKAAYLHVCTVLNASAATDKLETIQSLQAAAGCMIGGVTDTTQVKAPRVTEFRDVVAECASEHGISPPQCLLADVTEKKRPFGHLEGLSVVPDGFIVLALGPADAAEIAEGLAFP